MTTSMSNVEDEYLVSRALSGDQSAVGEIYDRYADSIYSFCRSRLQNDADAADATQDTFVRAATRLGQLREPAKLRSWLYAIARNQIISTGKIAARFSGDDDMELVIAPDSEPDIDLLRVEAADQLWDAADGLTPRDQEVLELHLRHGLIGQDLAEALGVSESHANVMLSRMRDRVATSLGGLLVARQGRDECYELDLLLAAWDGRFTLDIRSKVTRHVKACDVCEQTRTRVLAGGVSFGILPIIPAPSSLRSRTLGQMSDALGINPASSTSTPDGPGSLGFADPIQPALTAADPDGWTWQTDGFPGAVAKNSRRGLMLFSAAAAFILLVVLGGRG
jgi:RNA polymerase sigma factor (sigma-70 family)